MTSTSLALGSLLLLGAGCATVSYGPGAHATTVAGPAGRLHLVVQGSGPGTPVVLLHGLGGDTAAWAPVLQRLAVDRTVVAFDARGHGESDRAAPAGYSVEGWADDLGAVLRAQGIRRAVLVGHSFAGLVLQRFAADHPDQVAGLVYADAIGDFRMAGTPEEVEGFARRQERPTTLLQRQASFRELLGERATTRTRRQVLKSLEALDPVAWSRLRAAMGRFVPPGGAEEVPTLAIEAAGNQAPVRYSALRPRVKVVELSNTSHWVMLDAPQGFAQALADFLATVP